MIDVTCDGYTKLLKNYMKKPEGKYVLYLDSKVSNGQFFRITTGAHVFILEKSEKQKLFFFHSSPGTGTRVTFANLNDFLPCHKYLIMICWTTKNIELVIRPFSKNNKSFSFSGKPSSRILVNGSDGGCYSLEITNEVDNVKSYLYDIMGFCVYGDNGCIVEPSAIDKWKSITESIKILFSGSSNSNKGFYDVVVNNMAISILVTGFETYCKRRFVELELEGIEPNTSSLVKKFFTKKMIENELESKLQLEASNENKTFLQKLIENKIINFQNYNQCKNAYNRAYNLKFSELQFSDDPKNIDILKTFIEYRHYIIHSSPLFKPLDDSFALIDNFEFENYRKGKKAMDVFNNFIAEFHDLTLTLKPKS